MTKMLCQLLRYLDLSSEGCYVTQQAYCHNCGIISRGQYLCIFAAIARVESLLEAATAAICRTLLAMPDSDSAT